MKSTRNFAVWIVMGLLIVGLMGFGTQQFSSGLRALGSAGDKDIAVQDYANLLQQEQRRLSEQTGQSVSFAQMQQFGLDRTALAQLIGRRVIENEAAQQGISVTDEAVRDAILASGQFSQINGEFSREVYTESLRRQGLSEEQFETSVRELQSASLLQNAILAGTPHVTEFTGLITDYNRASRDITWAAITSGPGDAPAPTPEDLRGFYDENLDLFMAPESRQITVARLTPDMLMDQVQLDETALRELYTERAAEYNQPARRLVERLVFGEITEAQAAMTRIAQGATFEDLVAERGLDLADTDMGDVSQSNLGPAGDAAFAAQIGDVVGPFNSRLGPAIYRVNGAIDAVVTSYDEALPQLREELAPARAIRMIDDQRGQIEDMIAGGARLEDLTNQTQMQLETATWTPGASDGVLGYEAITNAIPGLAQGDLPKLIELGDGGLAALRLEELREAAAKPFESVAGDVDAAWRRAQTVTNARAHAVSLAETLRTGADFPADLTTSSETDLTRDGFIPDTPSALIAQAMEATAGDIRVIDTDQGAILLRVDDAKLAPEDADTQTLRSQIDASLAEGMNQDIFAAFAIAVQARTDVTLNDAAVNAVHAQMQ